VTNAGAWRNRTAKASDDFKKYDLKRKKAAPMVPPFPSLRGSGPKTGSRGFLVCAKVHRLRSAAVCFDLKFHGLAIAQSVQAGSLHGSDVDENVLFTAIRSDKAEAFGGVEKFDGAFGHFLVVLHVRFAS